MRGIESGISWIDDEHESHLPQEPVPVISPSGDEEREKWPG